MSDEVTVTLSMLEARALVRNGNLIVNVWGAVAPDEVCEHASSLHSALMKLETEMIVAGVTEP